MDKPKLSLKDLERARAITPEAEPDKIKLPRVNHRKMREAISTRLIASEYLRNGLDIKKAYEGVTRKRYTPARFTAILARDNSFMDELNVALQTADVEKNKVLALLWALATSSPLDFMDDDGTTMTVAELKKLPREMQAIIEQIEVKTDYEPIKDEHGKMMRDDDGKALLKPVQRVKIRLSNKQAALTTIAQIGKLLGPTMMQQTNYIVSIGQSMADADTRRLELLQQRHVIEHKS